jgi:mono/diheme cytochrome c family protein
MNCRWQTGSFIAACAVLFACVGCKNVPGRPQPPAQRPSEVMSFPVLYKQNCAACHGEGGRGGAAISLGNPVYLQLAGTQKIEQITANGVPNTLMPPFAKSQGGMLTDQQIEVIAQGIIDNWGHDISAGGQKLPAYAATTQGNAANGKVVFQTFCASCHGADGTGADKNGVNAGSVVDPAYLALVSDQGLRSLIIAGQPNQGMPDWKSDIIGSGARAMTDQEVTDLVAWLVSHRIASPGQPYANSID